MIVNDTAVRFASQIPEANAGQLAEGIAQARSNALVQLRSDDTPPVFARFVEPPLKVQQAISNTAAPRVRSLGQSMRTTLNHQLLAAASDKQTAADAFIDGQYRGAFSFNLCATTRLNADKSYAEVMRVTQQRIKSQGFSQDPQIDGPFTNSVIFGSKSSAGPMPGATTHSTGEDSLSAVPVSSGQSTSVPAPCGCSHESTGKATESNPLNPLATLDSLLRVSEKLVDLALSQAKSVAPTVAMQRSQASEVIVYVHGISEHLPGYSQVWHQALAPHLRREMRTGEVRWSQLVNARGASDLEKAAGESALKMQIKAELEQRRQHELTMATARSGESDRAPNMPSIVGERSFSLDDFSRYMLSASTREAILNEFFRIVVPELEAGSKVHIISHSWGTVVAYEGLRRLDNRSLPGQVANLFTVGSALSIGAVQSNLFGRVTDGRAPKCVQRIINLDAGGDLVGGAIGNRFAVAREYLGLEPVGCTKIPFTNTAFSLSCAHRSYFLPTNLAVNRDIFAQLIN